MNQPNGFGRGSAHLLANVSGTFTMIGGLLGAGTSARPALSRMQFCKASGSVEVAIATWVTCPASPTLNCTHDVPEVCAFLRSCAT
jgi:hypothetical protein